jgi:hypothetical protein
MTYTVIRDTREQQGWNFHPYQKCLGMELGTLKTGDYTIKEMPHLICIERKASVIEIAQNIVKDIDRFKRELERMREYPNRYVICEFSLTDVMNYPESANIPPSIKKNIKVNGKYLIRVLLELQQEYSFQLLFCDTPLNAFIVAGSIMKRIYEKNTKL